MPGAHLAGEVQVGNRSLIGIGSSVRQQICIGSDVTVGAGAAVVADLPDGYRVRCLPGSRTPLKIFTLSFCRSFLPLRFRADRCSHFHP